MACCLAASHYLKQLRHITSEVLWHLHEASFTGNAQLICHWYKFANYQVNITASYPTAMSEWFSEEYQILFQLSACHLHICVMYFLHPGLRVIKDLFINFSVKRNVCFCKTIPHIWEEPIFAFKCHLASIWIPSIKIRQSHCHLIIMIRIPITGMTVFVLKWDPAPVFCLLLGVRSDYARPITG